MASSSSALESFSPKILQFDSIYSTPKKGFSKQSKDLTDQSQDLCQTFELSAPSSPATPTGKKRKIEELTPPTPLVLEKFCRGVFGSATKRHYHDGSVSSHFSAANVPIGEIRKITEGQTIQSSIKLEKENIFDLLTTNYRLMNMITSSRNVAITCYQSRSDENKYHYFFSTSSVVDVNKCCSMTSGAHSELMALDYLPSPMKKKQPDAGKLILMYTDREPCSGKGLKECGVRFQAEYPDAVMMHGFDYSTEKHLREKQEKELKLLYLSRGVKDRSPRRAPSLKLITNEALGRTIHEIKKAQGSTDKIKQIAESLFKTYTSTEQTEVSYEGFIPPANSPHAQDEKRP